jgi:hypothetical protein
LAVADICVAAAAASSEVLHPVPRKHAVKIKIATARAVARSFGSVFPSPNMNDLDRGKTGAYNRGFPRQNKHQSGPDGLSIDFSGQAWQAYMHGIPSPDLATWDTRSNPKWFQ